MVENNSNLSVDVEPIGRQTESIYEACIIVSKRARQINKVLSDELKERLGDIETDEDLNEESIDRESLVTEMEKQSKPTAKAVSEMLDGKLHYQYVEQKPDHN